MGERGRGRSASTKLGSSTTSPEAAPSIARTRVAVSVTDDLSRYDQPRASPAGRLAMYCLSRWAESSTTPTWGWRARMRAAASIPFMPGPSSMSRKSPSSSMTSTRTGFGAAMDRLPASSLASLQKYSGSAPALEIVSVRPAGLGWGYGGPLTGAMAAGYNLTWLQEEGRPLRPSWAVEESPDSTEQGARRKPGSGNRQLEPQRRPPARSRRGRSEKGNPPRCNPKHGR